jgi:hypothetical protein
VRERLAPAQPDRTFPLESIKALIQIPALLVGERQRTRFSPERFPQFIQKLELLLARKRRYVHGVLCHDRSMPCSVRGSQWICEYARLGPMIRAIALTGADPRPRALTSLPASGAVAAPSRFT